MLGDVANALEGWIMQVIPDNVVSFDAPGKQPVDAASISLYLFQIRDDSNTRSSNGTGHCITLRYLVTAWNSDDAHLANESLLTLLSAAIERPDLEVDLEPLSPLTWHGFGLPERPAFVIETHAAPIAGHTHRVPQLVREPLQVQMLSVGSIVGRVVAAPEGNGGVGPDPSPDATRTGIGFPIAEAYVMLPAIGRITQTDADGCFRFDGVPQSGRPVTVRVHARKQVQDFALDPRQSPDEPFLIRFAVKEL